MCVSEAHGPTTKIRLLCVASVALARHPPRRRDTEANACAHGTHNDAPNTNSTTPNSGEQVKCTRCACAQQCVIIASLSLSCETRGCSTYVIRRSATDYGKDLRACFPPRLRCGLIRNGGKNSEMGTRTECYSIFRFCESDALRKLTVFSAGIRSRRT